MGRCRFDGFGRHARLGLEFALLRRNSESAHWQKRAWQAHDVIKLGWLRWSAAELAGALSC